MKTIKTELSVEELQIIQKAMDSYLSNLEGPEDEMQDLQFQEDQVLFDKIEFLLQEAKKPKIFVWDKEKIQTLKAGDFAPDCFGNLVKVVEISFRGVDVNGLAYVGYSTEFGPNSSISNSMKEGKILRTVDLSNHYTSAQIDVMEKGLSA